MECSNYFEIQGKKVVVDSNEITSGQNVIRITPKEKDVLVMLYLNRGRTVSRSQILQSVWGDSLGNDSGLTQAISRLRHIFEDNAKNPKLIKTIPKTGYQLMAESQNHVGSDTGKFPLFRKYNDLSRFEKFAMKLLMVFAAICIFLMFFDVNIRIEELPAAID